MHDYHADFPADLSVGDEVEVSCPATGSGWSLGYIQRVKPNARRADVFQFLDNGQT